jgi:hypothetical protein
MISLLTVIFTGASAQQILIPYFASGLESTPAPAGACGDASGNSIACATCPADNGIPEALTYNCGFGAAAPSHIISEDAPGAGYSICENDNCLSIQAATGVLVWSLPSTKSLFAFTSVTQAISGTVFSNGIQQITGDKLYQIKSGELCMTAFGTDTQMIMFPCRSLDQLPIEQLFLIPDRVTGVIRGDLDTTAGPECAGDQTVVDGACTDPECDGDQTVVDGVCTDPKCAGDQTVIEGVCTDPECAEDQTVVDGVCTDDGNGGGGVRGTSSGNEYYVNHAEGPEYNDESTEYSDEVNEYTDGADGDVEIYYDEQSKGGDNSDEYVRTREGTNEFFSTSGAVKNCLAIGAAGFLLVAY